jgi:hypothetical protein
MADKTLRCKIQKYAEISEKWCKLAQHHDMCIGCEYNEGRDISRHREQQKMREIKKSALIKTHLKNQQNLL